MLLKTALYGFIHDSLCLFHQILGFTHIDKSSGYDIRSGQQLVAVALQGQNDDDDTVLGQILAVTQHDIADVADAETVHHDGSGVYASCHCRCLIV